MSKNTMSKKFAFMLLFPPATLVASMVPIHAAHAENAAYYHQFDYKKETEDDGDGEVQVQWRQLQTANDEVVVTPNRSIMVNASLYLMEGNHFKFLYQEMQKVRKDENSPWQYVPSGDFCPTILEGTWSAPDQNFISGSSFYGEPATFSGMAAVKITLTEALRSPEVKGQSLVFDYGISNVPIETILDNPFCPHAGST